MEWSAFDPQAGTAFSVRGARNLSGSRAARRRRVEPDRRDGLVPLPGWLLAASPSLPFDVFIVADKGPILYAARGAPSEPLERRLAGGLGLWAAPLTPDRYVSLLVGAIARSADPHLGSPPERAQRIRRGLRTLIDLAGGGETGLHRVVGSDAEARRAASAGVIAAAGIIGPLLEDDQLARSLLAVGGEGVPTDPAVERSIDGAIYAVLLSRRVARRFDDAVAWPFLAAMLLRDLSILRRAPSSGLLERHPLDAAALLRPFLGRHPMALGAVARHHERPDGSGYPNRLGIDELNDLDVVGAAADAIAGALPRIGMGSLRSTEALAITRFVIGRRFPAEITAAVEGLVVEFGPIGGRQRPA